MKISVYTTSYNQKDYLKLAVDSLLTQTLMPSEILIIDDGSTDGSREMIKQYAAEYPELIRYHFNEKNLGITGTRNVAHSLLKGDLISFVDGDDLFDPEKLETEYYLLQENPDADMAYTNFRNIDHLGDFISDWNADNANANEAFERSYTFKWPEATPFRSPLVKKEKWDEIGHYDEYLEIFEDLDMMLRLTANLKAAYSDKILHSYRRHPGGISTTKSNKIIKALAYIYKKNDELLQKFDGQKVKHLKKDKNLFLSGIYHNAAFQQKKNGGSLATNYFRALKKLRKSIALNPKLLFNKRTALILIPFK